MKKEKQQTSINPSRRRPYHTSYILTFFGLLAFLWVLWLNIKSAGQSPIKLGEDTSFNILSLVFLAFIIILMDALFVAARSAIDALRHGHLRMVSKENIDFREVKDFIRQKKVYNQICIIGSQACRAVLVFSGIALAPPFARWAVNFWHVPANFPILFLSSIFILLPVLALDLVFGEMVPRTYGEANPYQTLRHLTGFLQLFGVIFGLPARLLGEFVHLLTRSMEEKRNLILSSPTEEEIKTLVETAQETGEIKPPERKLIHSVFEFTDLVARQIMTPRVDLDTLSVTAESSEAMKVIEESGHSRIPVYEGTDDQIVGIVHMKDLFLSMIRTPAKTELRALMRSPMFIPENKNLYQLLQEMRTNRSQMAIVQDEFGGTAGIVTIEDIVEELVGEIIDEYDTEEPTMVPHHLGFLVDGRLGLADLNESIGSDFESPEFETIGGYVFGLFGRQPKQDERIDSRGYQFVVTETDGRRIIRIYIEKLSEETPQETDEIQS